MDRSNMWIYCFQLPIQYLKCRGSSKMAEHCALKFTYVRKSWLLSKYDKIDIWYKMNLFDICKYVIKTVKYKINKSHQPFAMQYCSTSVAPLISSTHCTKRVLVPASWHWAEQADHWAARQRGWRRGLTGGQGSWPHGAESTGRCPALSHLTPSHTTMRRITPPPPHVRLQEPQGPVRHLPKN